MAAGLATLVVSGGCGDGDAKDARPTDRTIGYYCDRLLPSFCTYAVSTCGASGSVAECITASRPSCCQGACQRAARSVCAVDPCPEGGEDEVVATCLQAYTGSPTPLSDAAGTAGAAGATTGNGAGLDCASLNAGFAPAACTEKFLLLSAPAAPLEPATGLSVEVR